MGSNCKLVYHEKFNYAFKAAANLRFLDVFVRRIDERVEDKMPSIRTPQSAKATAESKSLKRKLFEDGEKKPPKPASIKRKKTNSQPGSPTLNTSRPHPLSERQQLALLKQLTAKEAKDSPGNGCGHQTPKHESQTISTFKKGINKKNDKGETALHRAAIQGDVQAAKSLIKQGADVNVQDFACWSPLHEACNHGSYDVAKQLLKAGAYVNILGLEDDTPLHDAAINGHVKLVELLLKHGADPLQVNKKGKSPFDLASNEIRALMRNEIIESCSDSSLLEANSPTSPESLDSAEESSNLGRDINGETQVPEPVVDPYEFPSEQQPTGEQKIRIHYKVPVKNGKSARVMDVITIPKTTQTIHAQQQERNAAGTPNSMDSLSSGDSDLFDPHLNTKSDIKSPNLNDVCIQDKPQGPSILTAAASTPSSSSTPKHATPRLPVQEQSELARIPETRDDSESSLSESNLYISDDSNLTAESRGSVAGKADSTTTELLTFSLGHPIEKKHPNLMRTVENASVLSTCTPADSSDSNVFIPNTNYSRVPSGIPLPATTPREACSSLLQSVSVTTKPVTDLLRTSSLPMSVQPAVQHTHHQPSAKFAVSRNSPDSQALLDSRRTVPTESNSRRIFPTENSSIHAAVSAKHSSVEEPVVSQTTGNRQPSVLPQEAQVHIEKQDLKSESESDSLPEWRTEAKIAAVSEPRAESESSDSLSEKLHHSGRERSKKHKERSDKKSHRKHHRHQGSSSVRSSKEDRHVNEDNNASFTSSARSPTRNPSTDGESRTDTNDGGGGKSDTQNTKDSHCSSKDSSQQRQSSPPQFNCAREVYYIVPPSSSADDSKSSEIKTLLIRRNPNMVQSKPKEPPTTASSNSLQSVSSTSASSPTENTSKSTEKDSKPSTSTAASVGNDSRTDLCSSNEASNRKSPSSEVSNRKSPITRDLERRKSPARGSPDITSSSVSGTIQPGVSGKSSPKNVEPINDDSKPKVTRTLRSNSNLNVVTDATKPDNNGNNEGKAEMTVMTRSRRAAESSNGNGSMPEPQNVESHPRKRKIARHNKQQQHEDPPYPLPTPLPPQDKVNTMEMFINIRNEVSQRQKTLIADVQPKIPNGFQEYLMCRKTYLLESSPKTKVKGVIPQMTAPPELPSPLLSQFQEQEKMRYMLRMRHYIEREKLMLSAEQDIMRVHGKAARAYANQRMPFSACVVFRDQEIYNMPEPLPPDDSKNICTRFNGRQLYSLLQDVDMKYERIKEELLQRHQHESSSLYAMQRLDWELKLQDLKMWDPKSPPKITDEHVPMVQVNRDFDLLPCTHGTS
ncbi:uncharacterized protein [Amphiura filiformis]|uniref:uncharacterized protein isoform X2 n=1 Tax=Amphiura filiformis TaxID=82378 RepID=UPI003B21F16F